MRDTAEPVASVPVEPKRTLAGLVRYFARLGSWGFGGPIALAGYMHRDLVVARRWFTEDEYQQGLAISQAMPGPWRRNSRCGFATSSEAGAERFLVTLPFLVRRINETM